jgi:flagellar basal-body rod modification protein FlgD
MSQSISNTGTTALATATQAAAGLTGTGGSSSSGSASQSALASLTDNYQSFLQMLMTQLQNQDPTSPMDSSQFTSELVQFAGVEQQINTNSNLTQLIQLTQGDTVMQSGQLLGKQVQVTSSQLSLQNGTAAIDFTAPTAEPVAVAVYSSTGQQIYTTTLSASQGSNSWIWNGQSASGGTAPDGAYNVAVAGIAADGSTATLPFTVVGTVTGVQASGSSVMVQLGQLSVNMSAVTAVGN